MKPQKFTVQATVNSLFGTAVSTVDIEISANGSMTMSQDGVQVDLAPSQVAILCEKLAISKGAH